MKAWILTWIVWIGSVTGLAGSFLMFRTSLKYRNLPNDVVKYSQVPKGKRFTKDTIPSGLLKAHNTKEGTWGLIRVSQGKLKYHIQEPQQSSQILDPEHPGVIEPKIYHRVEPLSDDVEFVVEFYRVPKTGPVDEKREGLNE